MSSRLLFLDPKCLDNKDIRVGFISKMDTYFHKSREIVLLTDDFKTDALKVYDTGVTNFIIAGIPNSVDAIREYLTKYHEYQYIRGGSFVTLQWSDLDEFNSRTGYRYDHPYCAADFQILCNLTLPNWLESRKFIW
jgi:hypothetical protein